jgi:HEPN domain-containing protein
MQPASARDFLKAARQRLDASQEIFLKLRRNLEAKYLAGYAVECSLKGLILHRTEAAAFEEKLERITQGAKWHNFEVLKEELKKSDVDLPLDMVRRLKRINNDWTPSLRYECGRLDTGETRAFIRTAELIHHWVAGEMS